jgi:hypothetical protein
MGGQRPVSGGQSNFRIWQTASFKQLGRVTAFQPKGDIHVKALSRDTYRQPRSRLRLLEAPHALDLRPPIRKAIDIEDDVLVRRERDIERDRREIEVGKA